MSFRITPATAAGGSTASIIASTPPKDVPTNMAEVISKVARTADRSARCDSNRVVFGIAIVLGLSVTAIIERQHKSRLRRIGCQRRRQGMKVGCGAGETR